MNRLPPVQWLRSFEAAARHLSFTHAATELHVTQSSVSQQVKLLENHLGEPLFVRRVRSLELTNSGRLYLPWVQQAFDTLRQGTEMFTGTPHRSSVTVRANIAFICCALNPRLADFYTYHPEIQTNLTTMIWHQDYGLGEADHLEVRFGQADWDSPNRFAFPRQHYFPVCSPEVAAQLTHPEQLLSLPRWDTQGSLDRWERWLSSAGISGEAEQPVHFTSTYVVSMDMAKRGLGVALGHPLVCQQQLDSGELVRPFDIEFEMMENYYLVAEHKPSDHPNELFCRWLMEQFQVTDS